MTIVNYLVGELSDNQMINTEAIDCLLESWEKKNYVTPSLSPTKEKIIFERIHHIG